MNPLKRFWNYLGVLGAPVAVAPSMPLVPITQEQFADHHEQSREEVVVIARLYDRVVRANNAYVTRNFGFGEVVLTNDTSVPALTKDEIAQLGDKRTGAYLKVSDMRPRLLS